MAYLSYETKLQTAIQMVIMDALGKGHVIQNQLINYMKTDNFEIAVRNYISLLENF